MHLRGFAAVHPCMGYAVAYTRCQLWVQYLAQVGSVSGSKYLATLQWHYQHLFLVSAHHFYRLQHCRRLAFHGYFDVSDSRKLLQCRNYLLVYPLDTSRAATVSIYLLREVGRGYAVVYDQAAQGDARPPCRVVRVRFSTSSGVGKAVVNPASDEGSIPHRSSCRAADLLPACVVWPVLC